jgi:hypothetical protein
MAFFRKASISFKIIAKKANSNQTIKHNTSMTFILNKIGFIKIILKIKKGKSLIIRKFININIVSSKILKRCL